MFSKIKLTTAQTIAFHALESAVLSALITILIGVVQYLATNTLSWTELGTIVAVLFTGQMAMVYKSLASNPSILPAILDTAKDIQTVVNAQATAQPPVIIHNNMPAAPTPLPVQVDLSGYNAPSTLQPNPDPVTVTRYSAPTQPVPQQPFPSVSPMTMPVAAIRNVPGQQT